MGMLVEAVGKSSCELLGTTLWEFFELKPGLASLLRLVAEEDRDIGSLNLDLLGVGNAEPLGGSGKW